MLGTVTERFEPDEVNWASEIVWVKNTLCCAKSNFVMVSFSPYFVNTSVLSASSSWSLKALPPLFFIPIFAAVSNSLALPYFLGCDDM